MRLEGTIPDQAYSKALLAAVRTGVSLDSFVSDAVTLHLEEEHNGPKATPELIAGLRKAEADIDSGKGLKMAQVDQGLAAKRAAWLQANPH